MKYVQIGILGALLLVAGLLYKMYRGQSAQPQPASVTAAQTQPQVAEPVPAPVPASDAAVPPATGTETSPAPRSRPESDPAPKPSRKPSAAAPARTEPVPAAQPVQNQPSPAVTQPAAPAPVPETVKPAVLNPPPNPEPPPPPPPREPQKVTVPAGTALVVRLGEMLTTEHSQPGDSFTGTLDQQLVIDGLAIAERGSRVEGRIVEAERAGRVKGVSSLAIQLVRLHTSDGQNVAIKTDSFRKEGVASRGDDVKKIGVGAALGAAIGSIAGGGKGAAIGAGVGGAAGTGTVMATRGKDVVLPVETRITFRIEQPLTLTEKLK